MRPPRRPQVGPRGPQDRPRGSQEGPKTSLNRSKRAPRWPREVPKTASEGVKLAKSVLRRPKRPQEAPKRPQEAPKRPRGSNTKHRASRDCRTRRPEGPQEEPESSAYTFSPHPEWDSRCPKESSPPPLLMHALSIPPVPGPPVPFDPPRKPRQATACTPKPHYFPDFVPFPLHQPRQCRLTLQGGPATPRQTLANHAMSKLSYSSHSPNLTGAV